MITVNGESRTLEKPVTVTEYLEACNYVPVQVVVELNEEIIKRDTYDTTVPVSYTHLTLPTTPYV